MKNYESLADALSDLKKRGYEADFPPPALKGHWWIGMDLMLRMSILKKQNNYRHIPQYEL